MTEPKLLYRWQIDLESHIRHDTGTNEDLVHVVVTDPSVDEGESPIIFDKRYPKPRNETFLSVMPQAVDDVRESMMGG